jgi:hypothetical protein
MTDVNRLGQRAKGDRSGSRCVIGIGIAADDRRILYPLVKDRNIVWIARGSIRITAGHRAVL